MKLDDRQTEILLIAQEECAEVTQSISKILRFGLLNTHPANEKTNQERLEEEVGDLVCMIDMLCESRLIDREFVNRAATAKRYKLQKWSTHLKEETV